MGIYHQQEQDLSARGKTSVTEVIDIDEDQEWSLGELWILQEVGGKKLHSITLFSRITRVCNVNTCPYKFICSAACVRAQ